MKLSFQKSSVDKISADLITVFLHQDPTAFKQETNTLVKVLRISPALEAGDFAGKKKDSAMVYLESGAKTKRVLLVGLGEKKEVTLERYRRAAAFAAKRAHKLKAKTVALFLPSLLHKPHDSIVAFAEGAFLSLYQFDKYLSKDKDENRKVEEIILASDDAKVSAAAKEALRYAQVVCEATSLARDLANAPANEIYPETLAKAAQDSAQRSGYKATVLDERKIKELGMGGVIGVCQGSARPPRFIILEYGPASKKPVVLVGKGVTFDTGGISIKPSANMAEMKMDMSGAAAVIGAFEAVARLKLPVHLIGLIPAVENMPSGSAVRPGDILRHFNGKTSEVDNTDAEGRLILADALAYAEKYKPAAVIDLATLTGAVVVALGHVATGMMGNDEDLMKKLKASGEQTYERVWQLPLFEEYEKLIKSDVADVKNVGGRWAGSITAALFLKKFTGTYNWAHLDIAGTAILEEAQEYIPKGGSGVGVRLLTNFLKSWK
ncbi:MAG: leucyl aminopeptidase [Ignavibacteriales bacterium]|nr:leucyl aminopeptidase [Ignavibacteriales bacterium]